MFTGVRRWMPVVVLILLLWPSHALAQAGLPRTVLMLFSQRSTAPTVTNVESTFRLILEEKLGQPVDLQAEYLDVPDESVVPYARRLTDLLIEKYAGKKIDVVVVQRPEALAFLIENREVLFPGVPVVFTDVTPAELDQLKPPPDVTGALRFQSGQRTIALALDLRPETRQVVIVGGSSPFDRRAAALARQRVGETAPGLEILSLDGIPLETQLERLAALSEQSVVILSSYRSDSLGRSTVARDVLRLIARAANAPTFGSADAWLGHGIVGGDLIQYDVLARRAAELTARVLHGEPVGSIAPIAESASVLTFDWRELQRWGIDEGRLPAGSTVLFREQTLWSQYKWQISGVAGLLIGQGLLIGALLVEGRRRRRAQQGMAEAEQRYRTVADFTADWEFWKRPDGSLEYVSPSCLTMTGYDARAFLERPALLTDVIVEEDLVIWAKHREEAQRTGTPGSAEFRIRTRGGEVRWVEHVCSAVIGQDGRDLGVRGSNRDITARKHAEQELKGALGQIQTLRDQLELDNTYLREQLQPDLGIDGLIGTSDVMRYVTSKVQQVAATPSTVVLLGETGVGKSLVAQSIHNLSPRRQRPLVTLNCAALPPTLIESELFGHEKGAFTGAQNRRVGRFEIANAGTLFLDEIGDLPLDLQGKLLRAVQSGEFERVGSNVTLKTDVRLIAATNRKLDDDVRAGRFRQDLWYRINVFPITVPPLRERREDIPLLLNHFLEKHCRRMGKPVLQVSKATMNALEAREWPGNIRELENVVERAVISSRGSRFDVDDVARTVDPVLPPDGGPNGTRTLGQLEHDYIVDTLEKLHWQVEGEGGAAEVLGINGSTLRSRMRKHGIRRPGSRPS